MISSHRIVIVLEALLALLAVALLALSLASGRWAALAQNAPITATPGVVSPPQAVLPDLGVPPYSIQIKLMCKATSITATMSVTVYNFSKVDADLTKHPFHHIVTARVAKVTAFHTQFDGNLNQIVTSPGAGPAILKGDATAKTTITLTNVPRSHYATYRFEIIVDPDNLVAESSERNLTIKDEHNPCPL